MARLSGENLVWDREPALEVVKVTCALQQHDGTMARRLESVTVSLDLTSAYLYAPVPSAAPTQPVLFSVPRRLLLVGHLAG